jgi:hypothetical protein
MKCMRKIVIKASDLRTPKNVDAEVNPGAVLVLEPVCAHN